MSTKDEPYIMDPGATLPWSVDWGKDPWLPEGDKIVGSTWTVTGITQLSDTHDDTVATVWLTAGVRGEVAKAVNHVVTDGGLEDERTLTIHIMDR